MIMKPIFNLLLQFILPLSDFRAISSSPRLPNCLPTALVCMVLQYATLSQTSSDFQAVKKMQNNDSRKCKLYFASEFCRGIHYYISHPSIDVYWAEFRNRSSCKTCLVLILWVSNRASEKPVQSFIEQHEPPSSLLYQFCLIAANSSGEKWKSIQSKNTTAFLLRSFT